MKTKPDLSFWKLWNLSFGFFGVQIAYALQSANISRIFATLGADPHDLSFFWILPPLMEVKSRRNLSREGQHPMLRKFAKCLRFGEHRRFERRRNRSLGSIVSKNLNLVLFSCL